MHHITLMKLVRGITWICEPDMHIDNSPGVHPSLICFYWKSLLKFVSFPLIPWFGLAIIIFPNTLTRAKNESRWQLAARINKRKRGLVREWVGTRLSEKQLWH